MSLPGIEQRLFDFLKFLLFLDTNDLVFHVLEELLQDVQHLVKRVKLLQQSLNQIVLVAAWVHRLQEPTFLFEIPDLVVIGVPLNVLKCLSFAPLLKVLPSQSLHFVNHLKLPELCLLQVCFGRFFDFLPFDGLVWLFDFLPLLPIVLLLQSLFWLFLGSLLHHLLRYLGLRWFYWYWLRRFFSREEGGQLVHSVIYFATALIKNVLYHVAINVRKDPADVFNLLLFFLFRGHVDFTFVVVFKVFAFFVHSVCHFYFFTKK